MVIENFNLGRRTLALSLTVTSSHFWIFKHFRISDFLQYHYTITQYADTCQTGHSVGISDSCHISITQPMYRMPEAMDKIARAVDLCLPRY
jgi:hypothetical protein